MTAERAARPRAPDLSDSSFEHPPSLFELRRDMGCGASSSLRGQLAIQISNSQVRLTPIMTAAIAP